MTQAPFRYKIFNDPVQGFIQIPKGIVLRLIDHPYVQRLRRIRQLGLGYLVFPGAEHSRFSHALGATGLMFRVLSHLREKNTTITNAEFEGCLIAVLLHDIGHGPFSHTLEHNFVKDFHHEMMTIALMHKLNEAFDGQLDTAIQIFTNTYPKKFFHQLISSQLDIDRLDYLKRDSVYTGVLEGSIGIDRILKTMRVHKGNMVIEKKGIYSVENYIISRRLMYMQVYLHKTVLSADKLLRSIFLRVRHLLDQNALISIPTPALQYFLTNQLSAKKGISDEMRDNYVAMDDHDVLISIKNWASHPDLILSDLCNRLLSRSLFRTSYFESKPEANEQDRLKKATLKQLKKLGLPATEEALQYYLFFDESKSEAYKNENDRIWILEDDDEVVEFSKAVDTQNILAISQPVVKSYCVHLKELGKLA